MKYLIYTRVSERGSDFRGDTSCAAQAEECRRHVLAADPRATFTIETDEFYTGTNNDRPALKRIMAGIKAAHWDCLVTLDMDRIARSQKGWIEIADLLAEHGKGFIAIRQNADFTSIQGRMMLGLFSVLGEFYASSNAQKTRDKMLHMARQGLWPCGQAPFGYKRGARGDNILHVDPVKAAIVKDIFASYAAGDSAMKLSRRLNMRAYAIIRILRNPIYLGKIVYGGISAPGKHEAIIKQAVYDQVQKRLPGTPTAARIQRHKYPYILAGKVKCQCGSTMACSFARNQQGKTYPYYRCCDTRCTIPHRQVRADKLDNAVLSAIRTAAAEDDTIAENFKRLVKMRDTIALQADGNLAKIRAELADAQKRAANLSGALQAASLGPAATKHLTQDSEALYVKIDELTAKITERESEIARLTPPDTIQQLVLAWRATAAALSDPKADPVHRRQWASAHIRTVTRDKKAWKLEFNVPSTNPAGKIAQLAPGVPCVIDMQTNPWLCSISVIMPAA